jgi:hypothetical protein
LNRVLEPGDTDPGEIEIKYNHKKKQYYEKGNFYPDSNGTDFGNNHQRTGEEI